MFNKQTLKKSAGGDGHHDGPHVMPLTTYFGVFGALLVLTVITVAVSWWGLPDGLALPVAMAVAAVKALLVCAYFMHLAFEKRFYLLIFVISILFMILFFIFTLSDLNYRGVENMEERDGVMQLREPGEQDPRRKEFIEKGGFDKAVEQFNKNHKPGESH